MDRKTREDILRSWRRDLPKTSVSSTGFRQKIRIEVDVSDYATEGVLSMECDDR